MINLTIRKEVRVVALKVVARIENWHRLYEYGSYMMKYNEVMIRKQ